MAQRKRYTGQFKAQVSIDGYAQEYHGTTISKQAPIPPQREPAMEDKRETLQKGR